MSRHLWHSKKAKERNKQLAAARQAEHNRMLSRYDEACAKVAKLTGHWCYLWETQCDVPYNCDNRCGRYGSNSLATM